MHIYNITCRIPEFVVGVIFREVVSSEKIHNFILHKDQIVSTDHDLEEIQRLTKDKFGFPKLISDGWFEYKWTPDVQIIGISYLGEQNSDEEFNNAPKITML